MLEKRLLVKYLSSVHQSTAKDSAPLRGGGGGGVTPERHFSAT